ncbi:MAG: prepilin-type N-terminal cleavage/methylation domain-containing protein, partial [Verrucomicrobia bacterium]
MPGQTQHQFLRHHVCRLRWQGRHGRRHHELAIRQVTVTNDATTFGVRRLVAAFRALPTSRQSRTAFERFAEDWEHDCVRRRQVSALQSAFTLIELILVMTLLAVILAIAS